MMSAGIFCEMESQCDNLPTLHVLSINQLCLSASKDFLRGGAAFHLPAPNSASATEPGLALGFCEAAGRGDAGCLFLMS